MFYHKISCDLSSNIPKICLFELKRRGFDVEGKNALRGLSTPIETEEDFKKNYDYFHCFYEGENDPVIENFMAMKGYIYVLDHRQESDEWRNRRHED